MFSKKNDFTNIIQYKIGLRIDNLQSKDYDNIKSLALHFHKNNDQLKWKPLHFLPFYYFLKSETEKICTKPIHSDTNLNDLLNSKEKKELIHAIKATNIEVVELNRPKILHAAIYIFPVITILGSMLVSTYLITAKGFSGWVYLSGLIGIILSLGLLELTKNKKSQFKPETLLEYAKSTYVIRHASLVKKGHSEIQLINFITEEIELLYKKNLSPLENIPEN